MEDPLLSTISHLLTRMFSASILLLHCYLLLPYLFPPNHSGGVFVAPLHL